MILTFASHHKTLLVALGLFLSVNLMTYFLFVDTPQPGLLHAITIKGIIDNRDISKPKLFQKAESHARNIEHPEGAIILRRPHLHFVGSGSNRAWIMPLPSGDCMA